MKATILIPGDLPRELSPNARPHRYAKARVVKQARETALLATLSSLDVQVIRAAIEPPVTVHWTVGLPARAKTRDTDNIIASAKAYQDGICDALAINDRHVVTGTVTQLRDPAKVGYVRAVLEWADAREEAA
jgi:hypothetical protein